MRCDIKDRKSRHTKFSFFLKRCYLKAIASNEFLPRRIRERAQHYVSYSRFMRNTSNRCKETGRARSVITDFQLSRHAFRLHAETGFLLGVRRSSW